MSCYPKARGSYSSERVSLASAWANGTKLLRESMKHGKMGVAVRFVGVRRFFTQTAIKTHQTYTSLRYLLGRSYVGGECALEDIEFTPENTAPASDAGTPIPDSSIAMQETALTVAPPPQAYDVVAPTAPTLLVTAQGQLQHFLAGFKRWRDQQHFWSRLAQVRRWRIIFVVIFLVAFVAPLLTLGATALVQYNQLKGWGQDGVNQL